MREAITPKSIILGLILGIGLFLSGSAFWWQLPNHELLSIFDQEKADHALLSHQTNVWFLTLSRVPLVFFLTVILGSIFRSFVDLLNNKSLFECFFASALAVSFWPMYYMFYIGSVYTISYFAAPFLPPAGPPTDSPDAGWGMGIVALIIIGTLDFISFALFYLVGMSLGTNYKKYKIDTKTVFLSNALAIGIFLLLILIRVAPFKSTIIPPPEATIQAFERQIATQIPQGTRDAQQQATAFAQGIQLTPTPTPINYYYIVIPPTLTLNENLNELAKAESQATRIASVPPEPSSVTDHRDRINIFLRGPIPFILGFSFMIIFSLIGLRSISTGEPKGD